MDGSQAVKPGVAGGADGDQEPRLADTRLAVMDVEFGVPAPQGQEGPFREFCTLRLLAKS
jgi:hypothetical protein